MENDNEVMNVNIEKSKIESNIPKDRATLNAWCRSFYSLNPDVFKQIEEYKFKTMEYIDKNIFSNSMIESMLTELFILGEVFINVDISESEEKKRFSLLNPDYVVIKKSHFGLTNTIELRPDENTRRICMSNKPEDIAIRNKLDSKLVSIINSGKNIPLKDVYHAAIKNWSYELRGTSIILPHFSDIMAKRRVDMISKEYVFNKKCEIYAEKINKLLTEISF